MGVEPTTSCMPCKRSSQLSYIPALRGKYSAFKFQFANINLQIFKKSISSFSEFLYFYQKNQI